MQQISQILAYTLILIAFYTIVITVYPNRFGTAESNLVAGQIRLQELSSRSDNYSVISGSSIIAKLDANIVFENSSVEPINLGIDGGSPLYSVSKVNEQSIPPKIVLIETNLLNRDISKNMNTLEESSQSFWFKFSSSISVLKKVNRPSTIIYARLKTLKDSRTETQSTVINTTDFVAVTIPKQRQPTEAANRAIEIKWVEQIDLLKAAGTNVFLLAIPQGEGANQDIKDLALNISYDSQTPIFNLNQQAILQKLHYSDGTHLTQHSARYLSKIINLSLKKHGVI